MGNEKLNTLKKRRARGQRGMTLIEIMIVIAIMGVMMGVAAVALVPQLHKAKVDTVYQDFHTIEGGLKLYYARKGKYPDTSQGLKALVDAQVLEQMPKDPWGHDYVYVVEGGKYVLTSYGADGQASGTDNDADLSSNKPRPE